MPSIPTWGSCFFPVPPWNCDRYIPFLAAYPSENAKGKTKHITALEENDEPYMSIRVTIQYTNCLFTSSCRMTFTAATIMWSWNSNVTYVAHYGKGHLTKPSQVLKSTLQKQSNGRLLEGTTKYPYVNRHGIFLTLWRRNFFLNISTLCM
jgi:hypothetical protein